MILPRDGGWYVGYRPPRRPLIFNRHYESLPEAAEAGRCLPDVNVSDTCFALKSAAEDYIKWSSGKEPWIQIGESNGKRTVTYDGDDAVVGRLWRKITGGSSSISFNSSEESLKTALRWLEQSEMRAFKHILTLKSALPMKATIPHISFNVGEKRYDLKLRGIRNTLWADELIHRVRDSLEIPTSRMFITDAVLGVRVKDLSPRIRRFKLPNGNLILYPS